MDMEPNTVRLFICRIHAPIGINPEPNDDGSPTCCVCGVSNFAVKPYILKGEIAKRGWRYDPGAPYVHAREYPQRDTFHVHENGSWHPGRGLIE